MAETFSFPDFLSAADAAKAALLDGDLDQAARIYHSISVSYPDKKSAVALAADGLKKCGRWTEAVAVLESALQRIPESPRFLIDLAEAYREIKRYDLAASYLRRFLDRDPRSSEAWLTLARLYDLAGDWPNAEMAFSRVLAAEPMNVIAVLGRGDALFQLGRIDEALIAYRRVTSLQPDHPGALFKLGSALMTTGDITEAHDILQRAAAKDPTNARVHVNLGLTFLRSGDLDAAMQAARNALRVDNDLQIAQVLLGTILTEKGEWDTAVTALRRGTEEHENSEALFLLASVEIARGDRIAAERALHRILASEPGNLEARHGLAALHGEAVGTLPQELAREMFDRRAAQFDDRQTNIAAYGAPGALADLLEEVEPDRQAITTLLDLGCGTGLAAAALRDAFSVEHAVGIDVSPRMLAQAEDKKLYDHLHQGDVATLLPALDGQFEVIAAVDLFPHLADLRGLFEAVGAHLKPGGLFGYSAELPLSGGAALAAHGRFVHDAGYLADLAESVGLVPMTARKIVLRRHLGRDVPGLVGLLRRPAA